MMEFGNKLPNRGMKPLVSDTLKHGTIKEHIETLERAKESNIGYVWSGTIGRNPYLRENLRVGQELGLIEVTFVESEEHQESGYTIKYLK